MDDVLAKAEEWRDSGEQVALATVIAARRSAPRPVGSKLAVTAGGRLFGSVSGGCVEADVAEHAQRVLGQSKPELVSYGIADELAWSVGLACGGEIDVFVEPFSGRPPIRRGTSAVVVRGEGLGERWVDEALPAQTGVLEEHGRTVFAEAVWPPLRIVVLGAGDIAEALCAYARPLGWETIVVDPRPGLLNRERVPSAGELVAARLEDRPDLVDDGTAVVSVIHEQRLEVPALRLALDCDARYIGALGGRKTREARREALGPDADRIHGPVGLDLGAEAPAEIALAIAAEILLETKQGGAPVGAPPGSTVGAR